MDVHDPDSLVVLGLVGWLIGWLNVLNAELSSKRYWRGQRSQEVGGRVGDLTVHCDHENDFCINSSSSFLKDLKSFHIM